VIQKENKPSRLFSFWIDGVLSFNTPLVLGLEKPGFNTHGGSSRHNGGVT